MTAMSTPSLASVLRTLMDEIVLGSPDPRATTYMLNRGDPGLLASLDRLSAPAASAAPSDGASIAAHVDHLRYGLSLLNKWAAGAPPSEKDVDWTASWKRNVVSDAEWRSLRDELRREATTWADAV